MNIDLNSLTQQELIEYIQNKEKTYNEQVKLMEEELKKVKKQKKYGLVWEDHPETSLLQTAIPLLKERTDLSLIKDKKNINHMLIEGDNYHSLKSLLYTHKGLIDVIYIDPPYNTGNKDFVYNDSFVDVEDGFRHSKWLSFMEKRLKLAHQLLSDNGVIFISIDDNEQAQLRLLCDEIFNEKNFISNILWRKTGQQQNNGKNISIVTEYIYCYSKNLYNNLNKKKDLLKKESLLDRKGINAYNKKDENGFFRLNPIQDKTLGKHIYELINPITNEIIYSDKWRVSLEKFKELEKENLIYWTKSLPNKKKYLDLNQGVLPNNIIDNIFNEKANSELKDILGDNKFSYPKPVNLIKWLINLHENKDAIILDFFAGSGTTGHAVMELNQEDGGQRQFILCTNNEVSTDKEIEYLIDKKLISSKKEFKNFKLTEEYQQFVESDNYQLLGIARQVTYERLKRVMEGYTTPNGKEVAGLEGNNLHYYQTNAFSDTSRKITDEEVYELRDLVTDLFKIKHNTFTTVYEKDLYSIYENESNRLGILKSEYELDEMLEDLNKLNGKPIHLYLFTWSDEEYETLLNELHEKFTIPFTTEQMPKKILEFYRTHR